VTDGSVRRAAEIVRGARRAVALTGAGISTESGIPDFRGPQGEWLTYDPDDFAYPNYVRSEDSRKRYWRWSRQFYGRVAGARPNTAHVALAELESAGKLRCVVTQNIDGLHSAAGARDVIEIHGNGTRVKCLACGERTPRAEIQPRLDAGEEDPRCRVCGGVLKTCAVLFGEGMPVAETSRAFDEAAACDLMLVVGSSLVVNPAARLVPTARNRGAKVVIVNLEKTPFDVIADVVVAAKAAEVVPEIVRGALAP
jgi:NAD-dependent deacetylase